MRTITLKPGELLDASMLTREGVLPADITAAAQQIIDTVRAEGDAAVRRY